MPKIKNYAPSTYYKNNLFLHVGNQNIKEYINSLIDERLATMKQQEQVVTPEPEPVFFSDIDKAVADTIKNNL